MANLITEKQKKEIRTDYIVRLSAVSLLILSLLGIFLLAYIIPYYISLAKKDIIVAEQFEKIINVENKENTGESVLSEVTMTLEQIKAIELYSQDTFVPLPYIDEIIDSTNPGVRINNISFSIIEETQGQFLVNGISKDRESLVDFIEDLKSKTIFTQVESPVSDFAKDKDVSFSIKINIEI
jgi:hypothetical protein